MAVGGGRDNVNTGMPKTENADALKSHPNLVFPTAYHHTSHTTAEAPSCQ